MRMSVLWLKLGCTGSYSLSPTEIPWALPLWFPSIFSSISLLSSQHKFSLLLLTGFRKRNVPTTLKWKKYKKLLRPMFCVDLLSPGGCSPLYNPIPPVSASCFPVHPWPLFAPKQSPLISAQSGGRGIHFWKPPKVEQSVVRPSLLEFERRPDH